jgi:DNA repair photolyase
MARYNEKEYKTVINKSKFVTNWFWNKYSINVYAGCQFGCIYCDSRSIRYNLPEDFANEIYIKKDIDQILDNTIRRSRTMLPDVVIFSGVTDPYQHSERIYRNTRKCLKVLHSYGYPVHIITKSPFVLEDLDLLNEIATKTWCTITVSVATTDEKIAKVIEPRAASPEHRFGIIKKIKERYPNLQAGINMTPIVPFLCDNEDNLKAVVQTSKDVSADYMLFGGMTLQDRQAEYFLNQLEKSYPELPEKFKALYKDSYEPLDKNYTINLNKKIVKLSSDIGISNNIQRYIPSDYREMNYRIAEKLFSEAELSRNLNKEWKNCYWAAQNINNLDKSILDIAKQGELKSIRNVNQDIIQKIQSFIDKTA